MDGNRNGLRTKYRMARNQRLIPPLVKDNVRAILGSNFQHGSRREILQVDTAFNLRLDDVAVHRVAQIGVGRKEPGMSANRIHESPTGPAGSYALGTLRSYLPLAYYRCVPMGNRK